MCTHADVVQFRPIDTTVKMKSSQQQKTMARMCSIVQHPRTRARDTDSIILNEKTLRPVITEVANTYTSFLKVPEGWKLMDVTRVVRFITDFSADGM